MPTRMLREGILDSEAVNSLSAEAEVFYRRLMNVVDDYGRFDGRAKVLRARLYPLRVAQVSEADVLRWMAECEKAELVTCYTADGKPFVLFHRLGSPRAAKSKYPPPPEQACQSIRLQTHTDAIPPNTQTDTVVNGCAQVNTGAPYSGSDSYSRPTAEPAVSPSVAIREAGFDPLRESENRRKDFEAAWNASGLRPLKRRLTHTLWARLDTLLLNKDWSECWREALAKAGKIPFLASGAGRINGALDPSDFLKDDDFAAAILRGKYDQNSRDAPQQPSAPTKFTDPNNLPTNRSAPPMAKPKEAA